MRKRGRLTAAFVVLGILAATLWLLIRPSDPIVHGKRQSEWIKSLNQPLLLPFSSGYDEMKWEQEQTKQWRALGPQGIQMLCRALEDGSGSFAQSYLEFYNEMDGRFQRFLPKARDTSGVRDRAADLLTSLVKENKNAVIPALLKAFNRDPDSDVRLAISACLDPELFKGRDKERLAFLPGLIKATQRGQYGDNWPLRSNALRAMRMYPDQAATLIPVLTNALTDADLEPRWNALESLHILAPDIAKPQIVAAITNMFHDGQEQFFLAGRIEWLGEMRKDAMSAVPALLEETHNTNAEIAQAAQHALAKIAPEVLGENTAR